jgi:hypothetical protein
MNMTNIKKTEQELQALLRNAMLIHHWVNITSDRKIEDKIFRARDGTVS